MRNRHWVVREFVGGAAFGLFISIGLMHLVFMTSGILLPFLGGCVMAFGVWASDVITAPARVNSDKLGFWARCKRLPPFMSGFLLFGYSVVFLRKAFWPDMTESTSVPWINFLWCFAGNISFALLCEEGGRKFRAWRKRKALIALMKSIGYHKDAR